MTSGPYFICDISARIDTLAQRKTRELAPRPLLSPMHFARQRGAAHRKARMIFLRHVAILATMLAVPLPL